MEENYTNSFVELGTDSSLIDSVSDSYAKPTDCPQKQLKESKKAFAMLDWVDRTMANEMM